MKKQYRKPTMTVVELKHELPLLTTSGSGPMNAPQYNGFYSVEDEYE